MLAKKGLLLVLKGQTIILRTWALKNQMPSKLFLWTSDIFSWPFWANVTNGESFVFYWHFCPSLPMVKNFDFIGIFVPLTTVKMFVFIGIFVQEDQRWKFCFLLAFVSKLTNGESFSFFLVKVLVSLAVVTFIGHFGHGYQCWKLCDLEFAPQHASSRSPEAISGTPLCKQEFALQVTTVGMGLEVRIYMYTGREGFKRLHAICCKAHLSANIV